MRKIILIFLIAFLLGILGCGGMLGYLPAPPDLIAKVDLKNNYDGDIPKKLVKELKWASLTSDWAVPCIFMNVGIHFESAGDELRAIHFFDRAIAEARKRKDVYGEGTITNRKILALYKFGKTQDVYNTIKQEEKNWSNTQFKSFVFQSYGHYYLLSGDYDKALKYFRQSLDSNQSFHDNLNLLMLRRDTEMEYGIAVILADYIPAISPQLKSLDFDEEFYKVIRRNVDEGIIHLNQVMILNKEIRKTKINRLTPDIAFQIMEANTDNFLGLAYGIKGRFPEATNKFSAAGKLSRENYFPGGEINSMFFRQQVYLLAKNITEGQKTARQLNELADKYHLPFYQIWSKIILSRYYSKAGDTSPAINMLRDAIVVMETQHTELAMDMFKETFLFNRQALYEELIELLVAKGDFTGALETAERAKSWMVVDLLAGEEIGKNSAEDELIKQNKNYIKEIADGDREMLAADGSDSALKKALDKIEKAESAHRDVISKIKTQNEELYSLISVEPLDIGNLRQLLDKNTTLFSYYFADKALYIWAVTQDQVHLERVKITREEAAKLVSSFVAAIAAKDKKQTDSLSEQVYDIFLKPVIPFVSGDRLGFIPHGPLYYLPFAAMSYKGQYLIDGFSIFTLPDAGALKYIMKKQTTQDIKELIPATHNDGHLAIDEIFKLQFKGRAVLISDCKALPGFSATGAEIAVFNRSLLYAVSPSVVSAVWKIDDKPTAAFTDIFYRNLKNNESIADSLRVTQNEMIKLGYPPHDWAAFTLTGKY